MTRRLRRIELLVLALTSVLAGLAISSGFARPVGIVLGGGAAWFDFVVIRTLTGAMLGRSSAVRHVVPMAFVKSLALLAVPAMALLLPRSVVDGVSFGVGVTTLPASVVLDAFLPAGRASLEGEV
jgi:hypothetical protein